MYATAAAAAIARSATPVGRDREDSLRAVALNDGVHEAERAAYP
jgi:hypothetical protein